MLPTVQTFGDFLAMLRRRRLLVAAITVAGTVAAVQIALMQPHSYESSALIQIDNLQAVSAETEARASLASSTWLEQIEARLMRRDHLLELIAAYGLFVDQPLTDSEKVHLLRQTLRIVPVSRSAPVYGIEPAMGLLRVTAEAESAELAALMANDLAQRLVRLNTEIVEERVRVTAAFYQLEEERLGRQIAEVEAKITDYRRRNFGLLPTGVHNRTEELLQIGEAIRAIDGELVAAQRQLAAMGDRMSVVERQAADDLTQQISVLETRREALQARVTEIEDTARQSVNAEAELAGFARERDTLRDQMTEITNRRISAESQQRRDDSLIADSFTLLEEAIPPDYPQTSQRKKIAAGGGALSVLLAILMALLMELRRPVIRNTQQMERLTGVRPVVELPDTRSRFRL